MGVQVEATRLHQSPMRWRLIGTWWAGCGEAAGIVVGLKRVTCMLALCECGAALLRGAARGGKASWQSGWGGAPHTMATIASGTCDLKPAAVENQNLDRGLRLAR